MDLQHRSATIKTVAANGDLFALSFSSEMPVERFGGQEILSHDPGAVDLGRLNTSAPLLFNHDPDKILGKVEKATISGKRGHATVRWGTSALATEIRADVAAGIITAVSVGYQIHQTESAGAGSYRATRWEPLELSLVSIPADPSVGIGRSLTPSTRPNTMATNKTTNPATEAQAYNAQADAIATLSDQVAKLTRQLATPATPAQRIQPIASAPDSYVDLSAREQQEFSVVRAIRCAMSGDWQDGGLERAASRAVAQQTGRDPSSPSSFFLPGNISTRATYAVGAPTTGGNLVQTDVLGESFIDLLRNRTAVLQLGATRLEGLQGNVAIPRQTATATASWLAESASISQSEGTFDQVTMSPKTVGALSIFSRLAMLQTSPDIELLVRRDLANVLALAIDQAAINGSGASNQPRGILNVSGIGSVAMGTNGAALIDSASGSSSCFDKLMDLRAKLTVANAESPATAYLTNAKVEVALQKLKNAQGVYLLDPAVALTSPGGLSLANLSGRPLAVSNQVPSTLVKGTSGSVCSAAIYGAWDQLMVGFWGGIEIEADIYSGFASGDVRVRSLASLDVAVRQAASFAAITDILA